MSVKYVYEQIVLKGTLKAMLVRPTSKNSIDDRLQLAIESLFAADTHAPQDLKDRIRKIRAAVCDHEISPRNKTPLIKEVLAKIRSLKPAEKQALLADYFELAIETVERYGAEKERRRHLRADH